jgi:hypothetical protein
MTEIIPTIIINSKKLKECFEDNEKGDIHQILESERLSASISGTNESNENLDHKSLSLNNSEVLEVKPNKRKFSSPISDSENFVLNFIKIEKETRGSYYNKLISKGLLNSKTIEKKFKFNNIFIFDWDDTLFCTTFLSPLGYLDDDVTVLVSNMEKIQKLESLVKKLLTLTIEKGDTYIITNSEPGWVEYSCKRFFPNVSTLLNKIKIISARGLYENEYPNDFRTWKNKAFNDIIQNYEKNLPTNIMCLGDSTYEIKAARHLSTNFPNSYLKTIKFRENPKIEQIINQLNLVLDKFDYIYSACKNWTITIDKKKKKNGSSN